MPWEAPVMIATGGLIRSPHRRAPCRRDLEPECFQRRGVDLREARERLDRVAQHLEWDLGADGERRLLKPLTGLGAERVGAGQAFAVAEEGQEPVRRRIRVGVGGSPGDLRQWSGGAELRLGGTHGRSLGIGVGDTRDRLVVGLAWFAEDVRGDDLALILPDVRQLPDAGDVADRPEPLADA